MCQIFPSKFLLEDPRFTWEFGAGNTYASVEEAEQAKSDMLKQIEALHGKQSVFYRQLKQKKIVGSQPVFKKITSLFSSLTRGIIGRKFF